MSNFKDDKVSKNKELNINIDNFNNSKNIKNCPSTIEYEKIKLIQTYPNEDFLLMLQNTKNNYYKDLKEVLMPFVPSHLKRTKSDSEKYGIKTQENFIKNFKLVNYEGDNVLYKELYTNIYCLLFENWLASQMSKYCAEKCDFCIIFEDCDRSQKKCYKKFGTNNGADKKFIDTLIKENYFPKEFIEQVYKYSPSILTDKKLEEKINKCTYTIVDFEKKEEVIQKLEEYEKTIKTKDIKIKDLNNEIKNKKEIIEDLQKKLDNSEKEVKKLTKAKEDLTNDKATKDNIISNLQSALAQNADETNSTELENLKKENDRLNRLCKGNIKKLESKINKFDKKYLLRILRLILEYPVVSKSIIETLNLKEEVIKVGYEYYQDEFENIKTDIEDLQKQKEELINEINSIPVSSIQTNLISNITCKKSTPNEIYTFNADPDETYEYANKYRSSFDKLNKFNIVNNRRLIDNLHCEKIGIPICEVYPEAEWKSVEDWFGKYENGCFIPSETNVSDYYKFIINNPDIPWGIIVINDFNKILPDFYLETFIQKLETNNMNLINENIKVDDDTFVKIESIYNLKYFFIKYNNDCAFDIPKSMQKYIVEGD